MKIKLILGYRKDQEHTIDAHEAHKAYYLFLNPDERGIFSTGLAVRGQDIQAIEPDYVATMGWNTGHQLTSEDWNEIKQQGVDKKIKQLLLEAKEIALSGKQDLLKQPLQLN